METANNDCLPSNNHIFYKSATAAHGPQLKVVELASYGIFDLESEALKK